VRDLLQRYLTASVANCNASGTPALSRRAVGPLARQVPAQPGVPVGMAQPFAQMRQVAIKLLQLVHQGPPFT